jgi:hypothetical protein
MKVGGRFYTVLFLAAMLSGSCARIVTLDPELVPSHNDGAWQIRRPPTAAAPANVAAPAAPAAAAPAPSSPAAPAPASATPASPASGVVPAASKDGARK